MTGGGNKTGNVRLAVLAFAVVPAMVAATYASVPFYRWFCQVTGFGGTTRLAEGSDDAVIGRTVRIRFSGSTNADMPWHFKPVEQVMTVKIGEHALAYYEASNPTASTITGQATYNVTPFAVGPYFRKIDCFCFTEQTLKPGETARMPVLFYVDPEIVEDESLDDVTEITLNYTFFRLEDRQEVAGS